jgi:hypothetical protein
MSMTRLLSAAFLSIGLSGAQVHAAVVTQAIACTTADGLSGNVCDPANTTNVPFATQASESVSTSGTTNLGQPFATTASAFVDSTNFGELRMAGSVTNSGWGEAIATTRIQITDGLTLSNNLYNGSSGLIEATLLIDGTMATTNNVANSFLGQSSTDVNFAVSADGAEYLRTLHRIVHFHSSFISTVTQVNGVNGIPYGMFSVLLPFTWGQEVNLMLQWVAGTSATGEADSAIQTANYDFANSIYWGGITTVTAGGTQVSEYQFSSDSGYDWRISSIPAVPEPASWILISIGLLFAVVLRRRRPII